MDMGSGMDMSTMDHSMHSMGMSSMSGSSMGMSGMDSMGDMNMEDMGGMNMSGMTMTNDQVAPSDFTNSPVTHSASEYSPQVDMHAEAPSYRLDDPGVGLRNNGRRVLTYADLRNLYSTADHPEPDREIELHLTGNMGRYIWSINGIKFSDAEPLYWKLGERVRITFVNDTMMNHPMHLHGLWSDLETGDNNRLPRKHTVIVQPGSRISYRVTVDAPGAWAFHCHLLYHMGGMFRTVVVQSGEMNSMDQMDQMSPMDHMNHMGGGA